MLKVSFFKVSLFSLESDVLDPLGGQTVTMGKSRLPIGWVEVVVDMGDSIHDEYELLIKYPAPKNARMTIKHQTSFPPLL